MRNKRIAIDVRDVVPDGCVESVFELGNCGASVETIIDRAQLDRDAATVRIRPVLLTILVTALEGFHFANGVADGPQVDRVATLALNNSISDGVNGGSSCKQRCHGDKFGKHFGYLGAIFSVDLTREGDGTQAFKGDDSCKEGVYSGCGVVYI